MLAKFIQELVKDLEIPDSLATEMPGVYEFPINPNLSVILSEIPQGFTLRCVFADVPKTKEEFLYTQVLFANLYGLGSDGCVLGLDREGKKLTLHRVIDYNIDYKEFKDILEDFLNTAESWIDEVKAIGMDIA